MRIILKKKMENFYIGKKSDLSFKIGVFGKKSKSSKVAGTFFETTIEAKRPDKPRNGVAMRREIESRIH